jgi:hypothetical protein
VAQQTKRTNQIFICYRREDSPDVTGRIYDRLIQQFGRDAIFKDVDSIPLGINFKQHLDSVVKQCDVVLGVIGNRWLESIGESGKRRLDDARDFVRIEIESALRRNIPVVPLFVQDAEMPDDEGLPTALQELAYRNGMTIGRDPHFHSDVDRLIKSLENPFASLALREEPTPAPAHVATPATPPVAEPTGSLAPEGVPPASEGMQRGAPESKPVEPAAPTNEVPQPIQREWFIRLLFWLAAWREARAPQPVQRGRFMRLLFGWPRSARHVCRGVFSVNGSSVGAGGSGSCFSSCRLKS